MEAFKQQFKSGIKFSKISKENYIWIIQLNPLLQFYKKIKFASIDNCFK